MKDSEKENRDGFLKQWLGGVAALQILVGLLILTGGIGGGGEKVGIGLLIAAGSVFWLFLARVLELLGEIARKR